MTEKFQITSQRKVFKLSATFFIAILSATTLTSCKKDPSNIGDGLEDGSLNLMKTDTFTVVTYSEEVDSIETDETAVNLLGSYVDPDFGKVDCGIVAQLRLSSNNPLLKDSSDAVMVVDSVVLSLRYTSINYYANLQPMTFEVYKITNILARDDQEYYAFNSPTITGTNLVESGSATITPDIVSKPVVGTDVLPAHLRIHLDPAFGMELINASDNGDLYDDAAFTSYLKGLYIKVDGSSLTPGTGTVLYFVLENSVSNMTLYFHDQGDGVQEEYTFEFNSSGARYNDIKFDRSGTHVQQVLDDPSNGKEAFYVQGSAIRGVIEFPHIMDFNYDSLGNWDPKIINKAVLVLPVQDFGADVFHPSKSLLIAKIVDSKLSELTMDAGSGSATVSYDDVNKEFRFLVTREIAGMLNGTRSLLGYRIYSTSFFGSTIERIVFNGSETTLKEKPRLEVTYSNY
jgi:hypothetical protein